MVVPIAMAALREPPEEIATVLKEENIEAEQFWIGGRPVGGCVDCHTCDKLGKCVYNDVVNEFRELAQSTDGFVFGAPVHYAHAAASLLGFMDRLFHSDAEELALKAYSKASLRLQWQVPDVPGILSAL